MESLKRSVSYSQPNICTSQGCHKSDILPPAQLASVQPADQKPLCALCNCLFLIGPVG